MLDTDLWHKILVRGYATLKATFVEIDAKYAYLNGNMEFSESIGSLRQSKHTKGLKPSFNKKMTN